MNLLNLSELSLTYELTDELGQGLFDSMFLQYSRRKNSYPSS